MPVPGPLQTVQRAEFWGAIIALQSHWPCHLRVDNLNVAGSIGRLLDRGCLVKPLPWVKDGDLIALVQYMIQAREEVGYGSGHEGVRSMLLMWTLSRAVCGLRVRWVMLGLMLLVT